MGFSMGYDMGYDMGLSENVGKTPKNPMVLLIIIPTSNGYFIGGIPHFQTYPYYDVIVMF